MKKILLFVLIFITSICSYTIVKADSNTTIRVWFSQYQLENEAMEQIAQNYKSETGINVEVISRINIFNAAKDMVNNAQLEERPDIVFMQASDIGSLVKSDILLNLSDYADLSNLESNYTDIALDSFKLNNNLYGVGYSISSYGLIYNKDLISEEDLPQTWSEFFQTAKALTVLDDNDDVLIHGTLLNSKDIWFNYPIIKSYGGYYYGQYSNGDYNPYDIGFNNQGMLDYIDKIKEIMDYDLVLQNKIHTESEIVSRFSNGQVAMILYGLWYADMFKQKGIDYAVASLPDFDNGETSEALTTIQGFVVNNYSLNKEGSIDFLNYMLKDENQQLLIEAGNNYEEKLGIRNPANLSVMSSDYIVSDPILSAMAELNDECEAFPNIPEGPIWYNYTPLVLQSIFFGDENVDVKAKLDELVDKIADDVKLINFQAERIELPNNIWLYLILILIVVFIIIIIRQFIIHKKRNMILNKRKIRITLLAWGLMIPMLVLLLVFYVYPIIHNFYLSLTDYSGINMIDYGFIGLANYKNILLQV